MPFSSAAAAAAALGLSPRPSTQPLGLTGAAGAAAQKASAQPDHRDHTHGDVQAVPQTTALAPQLLLVPSFLTEALVTLSRRPHEAHALLLDALAAAAAATSDHASGRRGGPPCGQAGKRSTGTPQLSSFFPAQGGSILESKQQGRAAYGGVLFPADPAGLGRVAAAANGLFQSTAAGALGNPAAAPDDDDGGSGAGASAAAAGTASAWPLSPLLPWALRSCLRMLRSPKQEPGAKAAVVSFVAGAYVCLCMLCSLQQEPLL